MNFELVVTTLKCFVGSTNSSIVSTNLRGVRSFRNTTHFRYGTVMNREYPLGVTGVLDPKGVLYNPLA